MQPDGVGNILQPDGVGNAYYSSNSTVQFDVIYTAGFGALQSEGVRTTVQFDEIGILQSNRIFGQIFRISGSRNCRISAQIFSQAFLKRG